MTQTVVTISERMDLIEAIARVTTTIVVQSLSDDGEWIDRLFSNENAAQDYERKMAKRDVKTRR